ncbi:class I SAM-dependent methyltransferase [Tunicatimonas pelagia]|uniref:class I SAM-dependent methyltransferase n=1 Tax=Tunicatimonas pelagia TaxID=931531 RepID=UPI002665FC40|nr:class I SAM-dependent methyltransferase [Tunicatimonas pelagia]WKN41763.1 class I SAM-dependent methyltransferase [Tunicatimonas pelagia]
MADPVVDSWSANASAWISTIENEDLESRKLVTNQAIVETIAKYQPKKVLDVGCGEGWLCRALQQQGIKTLGVDAVADFITYARQQKQGQFEVASYQDLIQRKLLPLAPFDAAVINFALLDQEVTEQLLPALHRYLSQPGWLFIQTLHPHALGNEVPYQSGWHNEDWSLMKQPFTQPYRWYYRTLEDWVVLFSQSGYRLREIREPLHPKTQRPLSIIFGLRYHI